MTIHSFLRCFSYLEGPPTPACLVLNAEGELNEGEGEEDDDDKDDDDDDDDDGGGEDDDDDGFELVDNVGCDAKRRICDGIRRCARRRPVLLKEGERNLASSITM